MLPFSRGVVAASTVGGIGSQPVIDAQESWYSIEWRGSRAGSRASRGFHFQDAVGAWFASRLATGELAIERLIPEGFDDLQLDGPENVQIEVKSRQGRLGPFPVSIAASHIVDAWFRHVDRFGTSRKLVVVFEQGLVGWEGDPEGYVTKIPIARLVKEVDGLGTSLAAHVASRARPSTVVEDLKAGITILICSWDGLVAETERHIGSVVELPAAALRVIGRALQSMVADAVDANAEAGFENRVSLDRTHVVDEINSMAELIDLESIEHALVQGICSPVNKEPIETGDAYYEGVSTQPGHVGAGLVVPRPDLLLQVMDSLEISQAVLLTGPSGVGKSAMLWTLPFALPGVLWFRVHRISDGDVPHVVRLLRTYGASAKAPVGLLVDAAGSGDLEGWPRLRQSVAAIPGVLLASTARSEDLLSLGDLADCRTVKVSLDEEAAATIHAGLTRRGATAVPHWREAFEQSHGLTLEFTHLLTQGTRLNDVLADQIANRIREGRALELSILSLVATADRWSASIRLDELEAALSARPAELRVSLARLMEEHLLVERDGAVAGIHQIRSRGIVDVIHKIPPPTLEATVTSVLIMLRGPTLSRFVYEVLREMPTLEESVLQTLEDLVHDDVERLVACLQSLELLDFYRQASAWTEIADRHDIPPAHLSLVLRFAILGIEFPEIFPDQFRNTTAEMASLPERSSTRDALLGKVGLEGIVQKLATVTDTDECLRLLRAVSRTSVDWKPLLAVLQPGSPLVDTLESCPLTAFGDCVSSARDVSLDLARAFVDAVGGTEAVLKRFCAGDPWIQKLEIASVEGELVGVARFLYLTESEKGDARERAVETGRQLLRTLPDISRVDVKAILPGGRALEVDGGSSGLLRQYDHPSGTVQWNQDRVRLAHTLFGANETERLTEAASLLAEVAKLVRDFGNAFVRQYGRSNEARELYERCNTLGARGRRLPPRLGTSPFSDEGRPDLSDPLSDVVVDVCHNVLRRLTKPDEYMALSKYINETVLAKNIPAVRSQPWRLLGLEDAPPSLDELSAGLSDIDAVLAELSVGAGPNGGVVNIARSGAPRGALARAADLSRRRTRTRVQERRRAVTAKLQSTGLTVNVFWSDGEATKGELSNFAVTVALKTLVNWSAVLDELAPKLEDLRVAGESPLLVPILKGRSVLPLAKRLIYKLWPVSDLGEFEHLLPQPMEQRLTTQFIAAHSALEVCSGLSILRHGGGLHEQVTQLLQRTLNDYGHAIEAIRAFGEDAWITALVDMLGEIGERIKNEWKGEIEAGTFAASVVEGALGDGSPEIEIFNGALVLSLQWDSDPASAVAWFESLEE